MEARELFLPFWMVPAEQGEVVHQCFRDVSIPAVVSDARGAVAFGELLAVRPEDDPEVDKRGLGRAERPVEQGLAGGIGEMFLAPDHMRYPQLQIVDDYGEVVRRRAVGLEDHELLYAAERHLSPQLIDEAAATHRRTEVESAPPRFVRAFVGESGIYQTPGGSLIELPTFALAVWALVERQSEPFEVFELRVFELRAASLPVGVLDTKDQVSSVMPGEEVIEERGAGRAEVEEPCGARGEADPDPAQRRSSRHTAWAAMPSPLPGKPSRSVVVPRTPTRDSSVPRAVARFFRMASLWPLIFGRSQMTTASTLATPHDPPTSPRTSRSNPMESASL